MKQSEALLALDELVAAQWGLVTSAQAKAAGVMPMTLSRLARSGHLVRVAHGVYRGGGAPAPQHEELRAAWLAAEPGLPAWQRLQHRPWTPVISGMSAAAVHGIGDFRPSTMELSAPERRQTQRDDLRYRSRELPSDDIALVEGLPVTTRERTIADLVEARQDLTTVAAALKDAAGRSALDSRRLVELLSPLAARNGHETGDGAALLDELLELAGLDLETAAAEIAAVPELRELVIAQQAWKAQVDRIAVRVAESVPSHQIETAMSAARRAAERAMAPYRDTQLAMLRSMEPFCEQLRSIEGAIAVQHSTALRQVMEGATAQRSSEGVRSAGEARTTS